MNNDFQKKRISKYISVSIKNANQKKKFKDHEVRGGNSVARKQKRLDPGNQVGRSWGVAGK